MRKQRIFWVIVYFFLLGSSYGETKTPVLDRIEIQGGVVLTGTIIDSSDEEIRLKTDYAGTVNIKTGKVKKVVTSKKLSISLPPGTVVAPKVQVAQKTSPVAADKSTAAANQTKTSAAKPAPKPSGGTKPPAKPPVKPPVVAKVPSKKPASPNKGKWELEAGLNFNGSSGNTEKMDIGITVDTKYLQKFYRVDLYGRYSYGTNRDKLSANEIILGGRYTNFFYKRFGFFLREELERDKFELIDVRSTSAGGLSYKIFDTKNLDWEVRTGLSYRYEQDFDGDEDDYPGMDFGSDVSWQFSPYMTFKGRYGFIPSFKNSEAFIITQNSAISIPFSKSSKWKIQLGITSKYNNQASKKKEKLDNKYYVRLSASWK